MAHALWTTTAVGFCNGNAAISSGSVVTSHRNAAISFGNRELEVGVMMCGGSSGAMVAWKRQQQQQQQQLSNKKKKKGKDVGGFKRRMMEKEAVVVVVSELAGREEGAGGVVLESSKALEALKGLELERSSSSSSNGKKKNGHAMAAAAPVTSAVVVVAEEEIESVTERKRRSFEIDTVTEKEMKENGFRSTRRTKLIATVGPACCKFEQLEELASAGMNVARLNMCHGTRDWHRDVIRNCRRLNAEKGYAVAVMMDTEGSEIHMGDLGGVSSAKAEGGGKVSNVGTICRNGDVILLDDGSKGHTNLEQEVWRQSVKEKYGLWMKEGEEWFFTVRTFEGPLPAFTIQVNYEGFAEDLKVGDELLVDGGMVQFEVVEKIGPDVKCLCTDSGLLLPRATLTFWRGGSIVREKNVMLPTISSKDWVDIDFGISEGVDFIAVSFVKSPEVIKHLKSYVKARAPDRSIGVFAKIEAFESLNCLEDIIRVSDGAMVARGDLGAQIPLEQVPSVQEAIINVCRSLNKPVIVASQLLESMIQYPTPTRAEVADISEAVRQKADALMLSGESAMGLYPQKALDVLRGVSLRMEHWCREEHHGDRYQLPELSSAPTEKISEQICNSAAQMADKLGADAIFVYTRRGYMASLLSRNRPDCPIFAFTESQNVRQRMNLQWGLIPFRLDFGEDMESNLHRTFALLKARGMMKSGDLVVAVSDISSASQTAMLQSIQVRKIP